MPGAPGLENRETWGAPDSLHCRRTADPSSVERPPQDDNSWRRRRCGAHSFENRE